MARANSSSARCPEGRLSPDLPCCRRGRRSGLRGPGRRVAEASPANDKGLPIRTAGEGERVSGTHPQVSGAAFRPPSCLPRRPARMPKDRNRIKDTGRAEGAPIASSDLAEAPTLWTASSRLHVAYRRPARGVCRSRKAVSGLARQTLIRSCWRGRVLRLLVANRLGQPSPFARQLLAIEKFR